MIALDTNVLVRLLVEDDEVQTARARSLIETIQSDNERAWVSDIVVCELVWVLVASYGVARRQVADLLDALLRARHLAFDESARLRRSLDRFRSGKGDFADYLIQETASAAGFAETATFDRTLLREVGFFEP